ncbi:excinuclease ABC subunit A [Mycoplasmopsis canis UF31]|uniref:excinuclease ABC subunit UvrA n=1 Tax=Mycoplasmopsis canis TaxID=29555 RepID=UPI00025AEC8A|nr:excinuclease ABC subunit UvrA [Mycoplasmopsis canis]AKF41431.1 excinuclease ABC subunit A [Mycoplasmopsis canis]EIE39581.1 excinuclease ABC subunit A [Mycoplasmopsis canis UF31]
MNKNNNKIIITGAKENNLKNVSLEVPKNKLVVFTGLSGSGKSSLAFNTIYEEGRRRYVDSLSSYSRTFLGGTKKPNVEKIEGLSPSISIEQKTIHNNPRSTVGTVTEIYDYLRLLYARIGKSYCPRHNIEITSQTTKDILNLVYKNPENTQLIIYAPIVDNEKGTHANLLEKLKNEGYLRAKVDGEILSLKDKIDLDKNYKHTIDLVIDRVKVNEENYNRISEAINIATDKAGGIVKIENLDKKEVQTFSKLHACIYKDFSIPKIETRMFSFNAPYGMCDNCKGLGIEFKADFDAVVPESWKTIETGAIKYFENTVNTTNLEWQEFHALLNHYDIPINLPIDEIEDDKLKYMLYGSGEEEIEYVLVSSSNNKYRKKQAIEGILTKIERLYFETSSDMRRDYLKKYMSSVSCHVCKGARLNEAALSVKVDAKNIYEMTKLSISDMLITFERFIDKLDEYSKTVSNIITSEIIDRLTFLNDVGLDYLTLDRSAETLSGGEAQRIRLATQIGSNLSGVLYVLDEPSIGLHQRDNIRLINTMKKMVDLGNTLIVVEHDEDTMFAADHIVDIGPEAGENGGRIIAEGSLEDIINSKESITGKYLSGEWKIEIPKFRRSGNGKKITIKGAKENNLKNIDVTIPLGKFVGITGVSGSGKSTLINDILVNGYQQMQGLSEGLQHKKAKFNGIDGLINVDKIVSISQSPIGRTPRSNPATYTGVFDDIREIFANVEESRIRGYTKGRFSFNTPGGRCEKCSGDGFLVIEMHFLPNVYIPCDQCDGKRYDRETLEIKYQEKNINDILEMSVDEAIKFFDTKIKIVEKLVFLQDVGLGYIKLGQISTTLSGGEAQRVKLATYLQKKPTGKTIYVLDEPTTGLHIHDIKKLISILNRIVDNGDTVVVIEHNLDVIKSCDHLIDLGPGGGIHGGRIVASGTPEQVANNKDSFTGQFLDKIFFKENNI